MSTSASSSSAPARRDFQSALAMLGDADQIKEIGFWMMIIGGALLFGFLFLAIWGFPYGAQVFGIVMVVLSALALLFGGLIYAGVFTPKPHPTP